MTKTLAQYVKSHKDGNAESIEQGKQSFDWYTGRQWGSDEIAEIRRSTGMDPTTKNVYAQIVDGAVGKLVRSKPRWTAKAREINDTDSAAAVASLLRYVQDDSEFDLILKRVGLDFLVAPWAAFVIAEEDAKPRRIDWRRMILDPDSKELDYSDAEFIGFESYLTKAKIKELWKDVDESDLELVQGADWTRTTTQGLVSRYRVVELFTRNAKGTWDYQVGCHEASIVEKKASPWLDEEGKPSCPIVVGSAAIDECGVRYSLFRNIEDLQRSVNYLRTKALSSIGARTLLAEQGVFTNTRQAYATLQQSRGFVEYAEGADPLAVQRTQILENQTAPAIIELMRGDEAALGSMGGTDDMVLDQSSASSGVAVSAMQAQASLELEGMMLELKHLSLRCARQVWSRIRQTWTAEKIVRITGRDGSDEFVRVNAQTTLLDQALKETGQPPELVQQMLLQRGMNPMQPVIENNVAELDVDIILDSSPDSGSLLEQKQTLLQQTLPAWSSVLPKRTANRLLLESIPNLENRSELIKEAMAAIDQEEQMAAQQSQIEAQKAQLDQQMLLAQIQGQAQLNQAEAANFQSASQQKQHEMQVAEFDLQRKQQEFELSVQKQQAELMALVQSMGTKLELLVSEIELNRAQAMKAMADAQPEPTLILTLDETGMRSGTTSPALLGGLSE